MKLKVALCEVDFKKPQRGGSHGTLPSLNVYEIRIEEGSLFALTPETAYSFIPRAGVMKSVRLENTSDLMSFAINWPYKEWSATFEGELYKRIERYLDKGTYYMIFGREYPSQNDESAILSHFKENLRIRAPRVVS